MLALYFLETVNLPLESVHLFINLALFKLILPFKELVNLFNIIFLC
jgi:hypothetical protein